MKIAFLGNSLTKGSYGGSFVDALKELMPQHEIINAGEGGNTVINLLRRLDDVLDQEPDGIFVMTGGNDAISNLYPETRAYYKQVQKIPDGFVTPEQFSRNYRELLSQIQMRHVLTWVGLPPQEYSQAQVEAMRQYNELARDVARPLNIPVLDLMADFVPADVPEREPLSIRDINRIGEHMRTGWSDYETARQEGGYTFTFDGLHPTPEAAEKIARKIADFLQHHAE